MRRADLRQRIHAIDHRLELFAEDKLRTRCSSPMFP
jgi:hypothetical protein